MRQAITIKPIRVQIGRVEALPEKDSEVPQAGPEKVRKALGKK